LFRKDKSPVLSDVFGGKRLTNIADRCYLLRRNRNGVDDKEFPELGIYSFKNNKFVGINRFSIVVETSRIFNPS